ncbi:MAG TPA: hypothetical protein VIM85_06075 [Pseudomonadales bacterium]
MPSFNLWAPELQLKPSPVVGVMSIALTLLALATLLFLPLQGFLLFMLAGLIVAAAVLVMLERVFLVSDSAITRVYYRDKVWWLKTRNGVEYPASLQPDSVVSPWFVLLNFSLDKTAESTPENVVKKTDLLKLNAIRRRRRSVLILPDGLHNQIDSGDISPANIENFRRLRVFLRFGKGL